MSVDAETRGVLAVSYHVSYSCTEALRGDDGQAPASAISSAFRSANSLPGMSLCPRTQDILVLLPSSYLLLSRVAMFLSILERAGCPSPIPTAVPIATNESDRMMRSSVSLCVRLGTSRADSSSSPKMYGKSSSLLQEMTSRLVPRRTYALSALLLLLLFPHLPLTPTLRDIFLLLGSFRRRLLLLGTHPPICPPCQFRLYTPLCSPLVPARSPLTISPSFLAWCCGVQLRYLERFLTREFRVIHDSFFKIFFKDSLLVHLS